MTKISPSRCELVARARGGAFRSQSERDVTVCDQVSFETLSVETRVCVSNQT